MKSLSIIYLERIRENQGLLIVVYYQGVSILNYQRMAQMMSKKTAISIFRVRVKFGTSRRA